MPRISASKYQCLRTCPRLFYWEHVLYMERVKKDGARALGTMFHAGLEAWWKNGGTGAVPWDKDAIDRPLVLAMAAIAEGKNAVDLNPYTVAKVEAMMWAYHARYAELEFSHVGDGQGVEVWFEAPLRDPDGRLVSGWTVAGKKDAYVHFADQPRSKTVEHKTTTADITGGSDYWQRLDVDLQSAMYVDAAQLAGFDVAPVVFYDVVRVPDVAPERATPVEDREYTKGAVCTPCVKRVYGKAKKVADVTDEEREALANRDADPSCATCKGTGWRDAPHLVARQHEKDEPVEDYRARVVDKIAANPDLYFRQADVKRSEHAIAEARADLCAAAVEIDGLYARARASVPKGVDLRHPIARRQFPRNTATCNHVYGRRCDWLDVCAGRVDPFDSPLYQIKKKPGDAVKAGK